MLKVEGKRSMWVGLERADGRFPHRQAHHFSIGGVVEEYTCCTVYRTYFVLAIDRMNLERESLVELGWNGLTLMDFKFKLFQWSQ